MEGDKLYINSKRHEIAAQMDKVLMKIERLGEVQFDRGMYSRWTERAILTTITG